ncbi:MAG: ROK family protein [Burkholderiales bacterium]
MAFAPPHTATSLPAIGVDLGGTKIEAVVLDAQGTSLWRERVATPAGDYRATLATVAALVKRAETELGLAHCSVGVGTPGSLTRSGHIKNANSTCLNGEALERDLALKLGRPVRIANDANCLALSEATDGAAAGAEVAFAVILGTGVGAGIVVNGRLLGGPNGLAGEWGHNPLPWADAHEQPGPACFCGQHGCIETWVSGPGMAHDHVAHTGVRLDARQISEAAAAGDVACEATLQRYESRLARSLAHVINLLDPDVIVLAGGVSGMDRLLVNLPRLWGAFVFSGGLKDSVRTRLVQSRHGDSSGVRGAAWLWR